MKSIDRLARDTRDLLRIVDELAAKGVAIEFLDSPMLNVSTKEGRAMLTVFAAFACILRWVRAAVPLVGEPVFR